MPAIIRSFNPDVDFQPLLALRRAGEAVDNEGLDVSEEYFHKVLEQPSQRWVMEDPVRGEVFAGQGVLREEWEGRYYVHVSVHPGLRRQGLGRQLMETVLSAAAAQGKLNLVAYANDLNPAAAPFLQKFGFVYDGVNTTLVNRSPRDLAEEPPAWPQGFSVTTYEQTPDLALFARAMQDCYAGQWGHMVVVTEEEMKSWLPHFFLPGFLLALDPHGDLAGVSRTGPNEGWGNTLGCRAGYIDAPGFLAEQRKPELYRAMVIEASRRLMDMGMEALVLDSWGDPPERLDMYRRLGFLDFRHVAEYVKRG
jgi:ribosomal protein S18 acetylase RimI-like enzyme